MESFENMREKYEMYNKMNEKLIKIFNEYSVKDEIYNIGNERKNMTVCAIKKFALEHIKKYGYIDNIEYHHYLILEILRYLGIELDIGVNIKKEIIAKYKKQFKTIINKSNKKFYIDNIKSDILYN